MKKIVISSVAAIAAVAAVCLCAVRKSRRAEAQA